MGGQILLDARHDPPREPVDLPQFRRAVRAVENKHRFAACPDDMDMGRAVVVGVDHHPQTVEAENGWHSAILAKTQPLGKKFRLCQVRIWLQAKQKRYLLREVSLMDVPFNSYFFYSPSYDFSLSRFRECLRNVFFSFFYQTVCFFNENILTV